jgi:hypothetical protein
MDDDTSSAKTGQAKGFDLDDFIASLGSEPAGFDDAPPNARADDDVTMDLGATLSYEAVGEPYPELPSAARLSEETAWLATGAARTGAAAALRPSAEADLSSSDYSSRATRAFSTLSDFEDADEAEAADRSYRPRNASPSRASQSRRASSARPASQSPRSSSTRPAPQSSHKASPSRASAAPIADRGKFTLDAYPSPSRASAAPVSQADGPTNATAPIAGATTGAVKPVRERDFYNIRGGGSAHMKSPLTSAILAAVVLSGVILLSVGLFNLLSRLTTPSTAQVLTVTSEQTRNAIDANMPLLTGILDSDFDALQNGYIEHGFVIFANSRYMSDSPDPTALGRELVRMPVQVSDDSMTGFYEGGYSAYSPEELQQDFNGAWTLDMTRGDLGSLFKLKYVNLAAISLTDEMDHLARLQGVAGDGVTVVAQGKDSRGNTVRQGTRAIGEVVYYWKIAACPFSEVYTADKIGDSAVYISVTLATYDFYTGGDVIS